METTDRCALVGDDDVSKDHLVERFGWAGGKFLREKAAFVLAFSRYGRVPEFDSVGGILHKLPGFCGTNAINRALRACVGIGGPRSVRTKFARSRSSRE